MLAPNAKRSGNCDLPADVIQEILLRLPVKTLLRFKCVCKHWYTLIGSPSFVNQHYGHERNQERLLIRHYKPDEDCYAYALYVDEMLSVYEEPDYLQMPDTVDDLLGPVNGIFCVVGRSRKTALLNPAMRQFKPIPLQLRDVQPHSLCIINVFGFGIDPLSGDYKVVSIRYYCKEEIVGLHYPPSVYVYNSGSDSWRQFKDLGFLNSNYLPFMPMGNTYLDGVYYWIMRSGSCNVAAIFAFNMTIEKFQEIQVPDCIKTKTGDLALYGDSIALLSYDLGKIDRCLDIWVMKKEGCWTKASTVGPFEGNMDPLAIGFCKNGELLLESESSPYTLCNIFTQKLRTFGARRRECDYFLSKWVFPYKESLVSIAEEGDDCMLWDAASDFVKDFF